MLLMAASCLSLQGQLPLRFWGPRSTHLSNLSDLKVKPLLGEKPDSSQISYIQEEHPKESLWYSLQLILVLAGLVICSWKCSGSCKEPQCERIKRLDSSLSATPASLWDVISPLWLLSWWFSIDLHLALLSALLCPPVVPGSWLLWWLSNPLASCLVWPKRITCRECKERGWSINPTHFPSLSLSLSPSLSPSGAVVCQQLRFSMLAAPMR